MEDKYFDFRIFEKLVPEADQRFSDNDYYKKNKFDMNNAKKEIKQ